jgi:two-component system sensor histidine kinase UhpB
MFAKDHPGMVAAMAGVATGMASFLFMRHQQPGSPQNPPDDTRRMFERAETIACFGSYTLHKDDNGTTLVAWSPQFRNLLGADESAFPANLDKYVDRHVHPDDRMQVRTSMMRALKERNAVSLEYRIVQERGAVRHVLGHLEYSRSIGDVDVFHGQLHDITDRKRAEQERLEAAARFQTFVEQLGGMPYIGNVDAQATNIYISPKIHDLLGFTPEQWCGDPGLRLRQMHEEDRAGFLVSIAAAVSSGMPLSIDYRLRHANGSVRWIHDEARLATDGNGRPLFLHGIALDITERKQAQEELMRSHRELKRLISALDAVREDEQKRLAREMHDDLGQLLAAMKMDLSALAQQIPPGDCNALERLDTINDLVNSMLVSIRRIIADLPPKLLDDAGLFDALHLLSRNFERRYGISCRLQLPEEEPQLPGKTASMLYRVVQESLTNIAKHAQATCAAITMKADQSSLVLSIVDNGKGASAAELEKNGSFGLICMRERVAALEGVLQIDTAPGAGMAVHLSLPRQEFSATFLSKPGKAAAPGI